VGLVVRARGQRLTVAMLQFVKGGTESGELTGLRLAGVHVEVVATGWYAPDELCGAADLVTQMAVYKHPYPGIRARRGIEY
jgi:ATP:corrinoid adenosyltransferase